MKKITYELVQLDQLKRTDLMYTWQHLYCLLKFKVKQPLIDRSEEKNFVFYPDRSIECYSIFQDYISWNATLNGTIVISIPLEDIFESYSIDGWLKKNCQWRYHRNHSMTAELRIPSTTADPVEVAAWRCHRALTS